MSHEINMLSTIVVHNCPQHRDLAKPTTPNDLTFGLVGFIPTSMETSSHESVGCKLVDRCTQRLQACMALKCLSNEEIEASTLSRKGHVQSRINVLFWKN